jgi:hypothetical protein
MLETVERSKRTALRIAFFAFPFVAISVIFDDSLVADVGWGGSTVCPCTEKPLFSTRECSPAGSRTTYWAMIANFPHPRKRNLP